MATNWYDSAWVDGSDVDKDDVRDGLRDNTPGYVATVAALQGLTTRGHVSFIVGNLGFWLYDAADTTTADDGGVACIVSADGKRYKPHDGIGSGSGVGQNLVINGGFQVNQRVFGGGSLSAGAYGFDRWKAATGGASLTLSGYVVSLASGEIEQVIESALWGVSNLASTDVTISLEDPSADLTITFGSASGTLAAGGGRRSVSLTTDAGDTGNLTLKIAKASGSGVTFGRVKLEIGATATDWEARPRQAELLLCYRYFWKSIPYATALTDGVTGDTHTGWFVQSTRIDSQRLWFPVGMRVSPTVDIIASNKVGSPTANFWQWFDPTAGAWSEPNSSVFAIATDLGVTARLFFTSAPSGISGGEAVIVAGGFACDAEL